MTSDEILKTLKDRSFLECDDWRYFEYGKQYYCGEHVLSAKVAETIASMLLNDENGRGR